jgi:predicted dienelactone hydrolase
MGYDPFGRGSLPVGVRTEVIADGAREGREIPTEIWYPATDAYTGRDVRETTRDSYALMPGLTESWQAAVRNAAPREGEFPLVAFSHGFGGHRRQTTFLCTHLASHGYVVVAPDHTGNTAAELIMGAMRSLGGERSKPVRFDQLIIDRPADVSLVIDHVLANHTSIDEERIGVAGHSFGGWTTLAMVSRDPRVRAALPLAPAGGASSLADANMLFEALDFAWKREVPTLFIVAERDSLLPLESMRVVYEPVVSPKQLVVINDADHMHFCDTAEQVHELFRMLPPAEGLPPAELPPFDELCPADHGYLTVRGLGLAHMDAHLKGLAAAGDFLADTWRDALAGHGVDFDAW